MIETMYCFSDISLLYDARSYLTKERFEHYMSVNNGFDKDRIKSLWQLWYKFPHFFRNGYANEGEVHVLVSSIIDFMKKWTMKVELKDYNKDYRDERLVIYLENNEVKQAEINLLDAADIIAYAALLQRIDKVHAVLPLLETIDATRDHTGERKYIKVYDQDIFSANDDYWREGRSTLYIADVSSSGGYKAKYHKLIYIKGKGYVDKSGDPNYDDSESYHHHVITLCERWEKIGNLITDSHLLKD